MKEKSMKTMYGGLFIFIGIILLLMNMFSNFMSSAPDANSGNLIAVIIAIALIVLGIYMFREYPEDEE